MDADLILTGTGGYDVLDEWYPLSDLLRRGALGRWITASHRRAKWSGRRLERVLARSMRTAAPSALKSTVRAVVPVKHKLGLLREDVVEELSEQTVEAYPATFDFPSRTQDQLLVGTQHPLLVWVNEATNAQYASRGLDVSHPFLDRSLIEFIASIPPVLRPEDGKTKTLIRQGFTGRLPPSVLNRRDKTVADEYLADVFGHQAPEYRARYPTVTPLADRYLDARRYSALLRNLDDGDLDIHRRYTLWSGWLLMTWLDGLARYRQSTRPNRADNMGPAAEEVLPYRKPILVKLGRMDIVKGKIGGGTDAGPNTKVMV